MTDKQPEALRLADALDAGDNFYAESSLWFDRKLAETAGDAAAELRRLHELTQRQDALLRQALEAYSSFYGAFDTPIARRRASDEFSNDARIRLRELDYSIREHLKEQK